MHVTSLISMHKINSQKAISWGLVKVIGRVSLKIMLLSYSNAASLEWLAPVTRLLRRGQEQVDLAIEWGKIYRMKIRVDQFHT
jgi:hypothetical protein